MVKYLFLHHLQKVNRHKLCEKINQIKNKEKNCLVISDMPSFPNESTTHAQTQSAFSLSIFKATEQRASLICY